MHHLVQAFLLVFLREVQLIPEPKILKLNM